ncbi:MAG: hypothetical protein H6595_02095 [Flavobacteriales bacterium]|nr:hypothetical protein [Flavobacteriales bacterium]MCB9166249.1 hypothetical protein [Flavobacteriales bacterium]
MALRHLLIGTALLTAIPIEAQSTGEFLITLADGTSTVRILPEDWRPRFEGAMLYLTPRDRMLTVDLLAVQPVRPDIITGRKEVKVLFRKLDGTPFTRYFLLPPGLAAIAETPVRDGFHVLGPQTLVRADAYRVIVE